ncbi:hypothetical protein QWZ13_11165 [Reinekea marina]|nr:hypothetical protein [Reinekea marina]MDN3649473.1 hypothetical protein [Reinekea marina]
MRPQFSLVVIRVAHSTATTAQHGSDTMAVQITNRYRKIGGG